MTNEALDAIRTAFDGRAATYDASDMHRAVAEASAEFATLEGVQDVLDIATGTGLVVRAIHAHNPQLRLTGTDISPAMIAVARTALPLASWIETDVAALPLADASVDLITCVTALHVIPHVDEAVAEWRRLLRPNGRVVTATFSETNGAHSRDEEAGSAHRPYLRRHLPFRTIEDLSRTAASYGFNISRHTTWTDGADTVLIAEWRRAN
ncbi:MAG TPA: methyltransferase type 11 [Microbacterium sp.]|uniref:class I SAM-dependent methyltransferase n=1 Tax=Microbacterium sp. TaxID=51671 RepID=UPI000EDD5935|nr:methyltransferase type 11 [Microbacterium sp.]